MKWACIILGAEHLTHESSLVEHMDVSMSTCACLRPGTLDFGSIITGFFEEGSVGDPVMGAPENLTGLGEYARLHP